MSEAIKIEGHVQWSGNGYKFFETIQPGLSCEDPVEHSTCKARSAERNAALTEADKARLAEEKAKAQAEVEKAAKEKEVADRKALLDKAGVAKHDARRVAGLKLKAAQDAAKAKAEAEQAEAHRVFHEAVVKSQLNLEQALDDAQYERDKIETEIEATDWIAHVSPKPKEA